MINHANIKSITHQIRKVGCIIEESELINKIISTLSFDYKSFCRLVVTWGNRETNFVEFLLSHPQEKRKIIKCRPKPGDSKAAVFYAQIHGVNLWDQLVIIRNVTI